MGKSLYAGESKPIYTFLYYGVFKKWEVNEMEKQLILPEWG